MSGPTIRIKIKGLPDLKSLNRALESSRATEILDQTFREAHRRIGEIGVAMVRNAIRADEYAPNSPITIILKGSSKPLVDHGDLIQSITYDQPSARELRIGLVKQRIARGEVYNIGVILHEGATIDVGAHPGIRVKVWSMVREALGRLANRPKRSKSAVWGAMAGIASLRSGGGRLWVIPPRPYLAGPLGSPAFVSRVERVYEMAAEQAVRRIAASYE